MTCDHCAQTVVKGVGEARAGVQGVNVDLESGEVMIGVEGGQAALQSAKVVEVDFETVDEKN